MDKVELDWKELWEHIVMNPDGSVNLEQVKKELSDMRTIMQSISKVYYHITGGAVSNPLTDPDQVIRISDDILTAIIERERF